MIFRVWLLLDCNGELLDISDESRFSEVVNQYPCLVIIIVLKYGKYQWCIASG